jgi:catechol 2,3-dioxygenase-like lactoylglutathione lyase family enzyme
MDGTAVVIRKADDKSLPVPLNPITQLRETVYGVADGGTLEAIGAELSRDREVVQRADGVLRAKDDLGFALAFQVSARRPFSAPPALTNAPGAPPQRGINQVAVDPQATVLPRSLSHVVYMVSDYAKSERFYVERLGFRVSDRFTGVGPFLRPAGSHDHHCLFLIQTPMKIDSIEHFTFHLGSPNEVLLAGTRFANKGYQSAWGPGRHLLGSNWFWYFNSPFGCKMEYDADMDLHDDTWQPRDVVITPDVAQLFLFAKTDKWMPGGKPH